MILARRAFIIGARATLSKRNIASLASPARANVDDLWCVRCVRPCGVREKIIPGCRGLRCADAGRARLRGVREAAPAERRAA